MLSTGARSGLAVLAASTLLLTGACGSGSNDDATAQKNIAANLMKSGGQLKLDQKQADCISQGFVANIGTDQLKKYKLLNSDLSANTKTSLQSVHMAKGDADSAAQSIVNCVDVVGLVKDQMTASGQKMSSSQQACVTKVLTKDAMKTLFSDLFQGDTQGASQAMVQPMMKCMSAG